MGSIVTFVRPRPLVRAPKRIEPERESRDARRALFILIGSFFATALVMCVAVVAAVSSTWTDVLVMSAFVLVFALLKIVLANALMFAMLRADSHDRTVVIPAHATGWRQRAFAGRYSPPKSSSSSGKTGTLRLAGGRRRPGPPSPH
jgi:uncharacterized protein (DUF983 family)